MDFSIPYDGRAGTTVTFTASSDAALSLEDMGATIKESDGKLAIMVLVSIETNAARLAFVADASATLGHLRYADEAFQVSGSVAIQTLTLRNATNGSNFTAQITPFFAR
jgi:hypothetical protein